MNLLLIEDDQELAKHLSKILKTERFAVDAAATAKDARIQIEVNHYDCLILDINLPDSSGFDLLKKLREEKINTPVIIVTARGQIEDKVKGLNLGADDYVPKPVDSSELIARIHAVIRRQKQSSLPKITVGPLTVTPAKHQATIHEEKLDLTAKEMSVLEFLAQHHGQVVTRTMIMEHVWGSDFDTFSNVVDVYIRNLRRKIEEHTGQTLIDTIRGKGYRLKEDTTS